MLKGNVLTLILFVKTLKKLVEHVSNVFGDINIIQLKPNALKLFAQPDMFQMIMENVLKLAIFAIHMMLMEFV
jgi:hypothetical protein